MLALTLIRRADILEALGRFEEALTGARAALSVAERHDDEDLQIAAALWEQLHLTTHGKATSEALARVLDRATAARITPRPLTRRLVAAAARLLGRSSPTGS